MKAPHPLKLFISYCHADESYKNEFIKHLNPLIRKGLFSEWHDRKLIAGENLDKAILSELDGYDIIVFLVSPDFLDSSYCVDIELQHGLKKLDQAEGRIFPIITRNCMWKDTELSNYVCIPTDGQAVSTFDDQDNAWVSVVEQLKRVALSYQEQNPNLIRLTPSNVASPLPSKCTDEFSSFLEDTGVSFQSQHKDEVTLSDIFAPLDMKYVCDDVDKYGLTKNFSSFLDNPNNGRLLILGEEQSGKTSAAKIFFKNRLKSGSLPIFLRSDQISKTDLDRLFNSPVKHQYDIDNFSEYLNMPGKKVLIIDDYTDIKLNSKYQGNLIQKLETVFEEIIIFSNISLKHSEYDYLVLGEYSQFEILPVGYEVRSTLIEKWFCIGREETIDSSLLLGLIDSSKRNIDTMLRKNIVPAKPIFILTILQTLDSFRPTDYSLTSHGHCYQFLMLNTLNKAKIPTHEIDPYINYLTELAYFLYKAGGNSLTEEELKDFQQHYSENYMMSSTHNQIILALLECGILKIYSDAYFFGYKYIFYFYAAKYISDHLNDQNMNDVISSLCEKIHTEKNANILIFITHHSKSSKVIDEIRLYTSTIFEDLKEADLGTEDTEYLEEFLQDIPNIIVEQRNVEEERKAQLKYEDEVDPQTSFEHRDLDEVEVEVEVEENTIDQDNEDDLNEFRKQLSDINKSAKSVEIIGQILRNRYGSLKKPDLFELALDAYSVGLRFLKFYITTAASSKDEFLERLQHVIREETTHSSEDTEKIARKIFLALCYNLSLSVIKKISLSVGSDKLISLFDEICEKNPTPAHKLINLAIHLEFKKELPKKMIESMVKDFGDNILCNRMLQEIVVQHLYMHYLEYDEKQWVASTLKIPVASQQLIETHKKIKR